MKELTYTKLIIGICIIASISNLIGMIHFSINYYPFQEWFEYCLFVLFILTNLLIFALTIKLVYDYFDYKVKKDKEEKQ